MSNLYFYYASMNSGKSTTLIQSAYNYRERRMRPLVMKPAIDTRDSEQEVVSRIGLHVEAVIIREEMDLPSYIRNDILLNGKLDCILVDEAQFLTAAQVSQLAFIVDAMDIPVLCYGLRNDFRGEAFPGSARLLAMADKLVEIKSICWCGSKSTHVLRLDGEGKVLRSGPQVQIGGNDSYVAVCRKHWREGKYE
ncbi:thymidine kinase [Serratia phage Moabite]|uniref:Thymidine kinase n=2 Tax=Moabitevirus moabite TaxID=2846181 RepID=A0A7T3NBW2_9CAUD|nr:thymidine kinase [Serratia phage Moabite]QDB71309.1 thymidine kinase [Serratia phage Moabite]QPX76875.1 putative thymidine kinase [Serratia phage vB_SmaM_Yaphecito]UCR74800.1 thymidine kinase [Serratia phage BUCT660]UGO54162.1 putative thymidine kinase [Serratia phage vB_SmaM_Haymo]